MNIKLVNKYARNEFIPNLNKTAVALTRNKTPDGIPLLQAAAKIASPKGAISPSKLTIEAKNETTYNIMFCMLNNFFISIFLVLLFCCSTSWISY